MHNVTCSYTNIDTVKNDIPENTPYIVGESLTGDIIVKGPGGGKYFAFKADGKVVYSVLKKKGDGGKTYFVIGKNGKMKPFDGDTTGFPQNHHIATNKNEAGGNRYTDDFIEFFENANVPGKPNLDINDTIFNRTLVIGHRGSHKEIYHELVKAELKNKLRGISKGTQQYRDTFTRILGDIGRKSRDRRTRLGRALLRR